MQIWERFLDSLIYKFVKSAYIIKNLLYSQLDQRSLQFMLSLAYFLFKLSLCIEINILPSIAFVKVKSHKQERLLAPCFLHVAAVKFDTQTTHFKII